MSDSQKTTSQEKWVISILSAVIFFIIASPFMFKVMNSLTTSFGMSIASPNGCPNTAGLIINALLFMLIVRLMMR